MKQLTLFVDAGEFDADLLDKVASELTGIGSTIQCMGNYIESEAELDMIRLDDMLTDLNDLSDSISAVRRKLQTIVAPYEDKIFDLTTVYLEQGGE